MQVFRPIIIIGLTTVAAGALKLLRIQPASEIGEVSDRESVAALIVESSPEGLRKPDYHELLTGAVAFEEGSAPPATQHAGDGRQQLQSATLSGRGLSYQS